MGITARTPEFQRARKRLLVLEAELAGIEGGEDLAYRRQVALELKQTLDVVQKYQIEQSRLERAKLRAEERSPRSQRFAHGTGPEGETGFDPHKAHAEEDGA